MLRIMLGQRLALLGSQLADINWLTTKDLRRVSLALLRTDKDWN